MSETVQNDAEVLKLRAEQADFFSDREGDCPYVVRRDGKELGRDGENPGPHVVLGVGVHGDEQACVEAVIRIIQAIDNGDLRLLEGSVSAILGNPEAFRLGQRSIDTDAGRCFYKGVSTDIVEGRRAVEIMQYIESIRNELALIMDGHTLSTNDIMMLVFNRENPANEKLLEQMPKVFHMLWGYIRAHLKGAFNDLATAYGVPGYAVECGQHDSPLAVDRALFSMKCALDAGGVRYEGEFPWFNPAVTQESLFCRNLATDQCITPRAGFEYTIPDIGNGVRIDAGRVYAKAGTRRYVAGKSRVLTMAYQGGIPPGATDAGFLCRELEKRGEFFGGGESDLDQAVA